MWNNFAVQKARKLLRFLKGTIRQPAQQAQRSPQVSQPVMSFDMNSGQLARGQGNVAPRSPYSLSPSPPPAPPRSPYGLSPNPQPRSPYNVIADVGLPAQGPSAYAINGTPREEGLEGRLSQLYDGPSEMEAPTLTEFAQAVMAEGLHPGHEYRGLSGREFVMERDMRKDQGAPYDHPAGFLLGKLLEFYELIKAKNPLMKQTFWGMLGALRKDDLLAIWKLPVANQAEADEIVRRFQQGVRMLGPEKRKGYRVTVKNQLMYWAHWPEFEPLDTSPDGLFFLRRSKTSNLGLAKDQIAIWVLSKDDELYTHPAKLYRFHHTSFGSGDEVRCAGEWCVVKGKLQWISGASGHYKPTMENMKNTVAVLAKKFGISANNYNVVCQTNSGVELDVPARRFLFEDLSVLKQAYKLG